MMETLYSLLLILTLIKKVHAFQNFMSVLITFLAINYEEMLKKDFASKYFLEVNVVIIRTKRPLQWLIICCRVYFLSLLLYIHQSAETEHQTFMTNAEAYLEPRQISTRERFDLTVFTKKSIVDFRLGFEYTSVMEEDTWK